MANKELNLPDTLPEGIQMPKEVEEKLKKIKQKLEKFKDDILKKFESYIIGVSLLPPEKPEEGKEIDKDKINVLVLVDDSDSKKMSKEELSSKMGTIITKMAQDQDKNIEPQTMLLSELREACLDGKYDLLKTIAVSAPLHDPTDILAALRISEIHKQMTVQKFEKYILSYVAAGSLFRGEKSNDIDVYVIVDDTDVKKMSRAELKDKLRAIIQSMAFEAMKITGVKKDLHVQTYILTDFWDNLKDANPVIYTLLRDGIPLYDRGVFVPWKILLQSGRVKPSKEAIDMNMEIGEKLIERTKFKMLSIVGEDLFYALLNPSQAALMLYGLPPPTPKETVTLMNEIFVKKEKMLEKKHIDALEKVRRYFKDVEHKKITEIKGKDIDMLLEHAEDYLKRIKQLFEQIEMRYHEKNICEVYDTCVAVTRDALLSEDETVIKEEKVEETFKKKLIETGKLPQNLLTQFKVVLKAKKDADDNKLTKQELEKVMKDARIYIKAVIEFIQRKKAASLERSKIKFKYGQNKFGEVVVIGDKAFITGDLEERDKIKVANFSTTKGLEKITATTIEEFDKAISKAVTPARIFLGEALLNKLQELFGKDVEILVNY
ncbi:hypothetical protein J4468_03135 [Candidatus Woesearchaeota archaeon]|nr:hypothetical protein [Candidatus Woesearchaeota archaeon]